MPNEDAGQKVLVLFSPLLFDQFPTVQSTMLFSHWLTVAYQWLRKDTTGSKPLSLFSRWYLLWPRGLHGPRRAESRCANMDLYVWPLQQIVSTSRCLQHNLESCKPRAIQQHFTVGVFSIFSQLCWQQNQESMWSQRFHFYICGHDFLHFCSVVQNILLVTENGRCETLSIAIHRNFYFCRCEMFSCLCITCQTVLGSVQYSTYRICYCQKSLK